MGGPSLNLVSNILAGGKQGLCQNSSSVRHSLSSVTHCIFTVTLFILVLLQKTMCWSIDRHPLLVLCSHHARRELKTALDIVNVQQKEKINVPTEPWFGIFKNQAVVSYEVT